MHHDFIEAELRKLKEKGLYRSLKAITGPQEARITILGKSLINLSSNNSLGLANHPGLKQASIKATRAYGVGAGASRLICGTMEPHIQLEKKLASFKGTEAAILFNSGYNANIGTITTLADKGDVIFSDKLNHASIIDACIMCRGTLKRYSHLNTEVLESMLKNAADYKKRIIITEGVFSMDGDMAPLKVISSLAERYNAMLIIDDAHATGALGRNGRGSLEHLGIENTNIIQIGTLSKAIGAFGAFVAGKKSIIDYLINKARPLIYTTALPPSICSASITALDIIEEKPELREALHKRADYIRISLQDKGLDVIPGESHIIPVIIGSAKRSLDVSSRLLEEGVYVQAIRPPTVPDGTSRLRITPMTTHLWKDIKYAVGKIVMAVKT